MKSTSTTLAPAKVIDYKAHPCTTEALVDDLKDCLRKVESGHVIQKYYRLEDKRIFEERKYYQQVLAFLIGENHEPNDFVIDLSDLSSGLLMELLELRKQTKRDVIMQGVKWLIEDAYFRFHYNPVCNYTKEDRAWSSILLCGCLIPKVRLEP